MNTWILLAGVALIPWTISLFNLMTWRRGRETARAPGRISVLIPARNEELNIERAVSTALKQIWAGRAYVHEVIVYDDNSQDGTANIVRAIGRWDSRVRLISGNELPDGWIGKPYACHRLAEEAEGELLLFMDADVALKEGGLIRMHSLLEQPTKGRLVSAVPAQVCGSFVERLILPLLTLTYTSWLPLRLVEWGRNPRTVAANGQLLLIGRSDYARLGGFQAVRDEIVDDVAFCRLAKASGLRVVFADGFHMASCRMYRSAHATIDGFSKNLYEGLGSPSTLFLAMALYLLAYVLPYLGLGLALSSPTRFADWLLPALVGVGLNTTLRAALCLRFNQPWEGIILHPISVITLCGIALKSWRWSSRGEIHWAGRVYASKTLQKTDAAPTTLRSSALLTKLPERAKS